MAMASSAAMRNGVYALPWFALALVVILLDQYTKGLASTHLDYAQPVRVFWWFNLTLHHNTGAAFSFLAGAGGWQRWFFAAIAVAASVFIVILLKRGGSRTFCLGLALILGGALGNLWDRVTIGRVTDFLLFHYQGWSWPAFNVADSAISVGAVLLILDSFRARPRASASAAREDRR